MTDQLVDTNVLLVASAADGLDVPFPDVSVDADAIQLVFEWLLAFRDDNSRCIVLDDLFQVYSEYHNKLNGQHFGLQVVDYKLRECLRTVPVTYDGAGYAVVPATLAAIDNSDKMFVAAALNDPANIHIVNACDSDWKEKAALLQQHGVTVLELLP